ncbi:MAG: hypothetical protein PHR28_14300 [candidate division Zixibacteria bacterium]|nr:hypothetical protein [candidate division Zixibacteria bacterium]
MEFIKNFIRQMIFIGQLILALLAFLFVLFTLFSFGISLICGGDINGSSNAEHETIVKSVTIKDKLEIDNWWFVYTTDREILTTQTIFLYRELVVNGTYLIEYEPRDPERGLNPYKIDGHVLNATTVIGG